MRGQFELGALKMILLRLQHVGLRRELGVRLLKFHLLRLKEHRTLLERAALLFELFVGDAQLFLLALELLGLSLCFLERERELFAVLRRSQGNADGLSDHAQQL